MIIPELHVVDLALLRMPAGMFKPAAAAHCDPVSFQVSTSGWSATSLKQLYQFCARLPIQHCTPGYWHSDSTHWQWCVCAHPPLSSLQTQIKALITTLMLSAAPLVRAQLGEALALISDHDFPAQWPTLLPELVQQLGSSEDLAVISGVCQTANSIFKRYRNQISSNELVAELDASQVRQGCSSTAAGTSLVARTG